MTKPDMTDDWMNPPKREAYVHTRQKYPRFLIQRKRRLDYFPFEKWDVWESFETRTERDAELAKLRTEHPVWLLRPYDDLHPPMAYN